MKINFKNMTIYERVLFISCVIMGYIFNIIVVYLQHKEYKTIKPFSDHFTMFHHGLDVDEQGFLYLGKSYKVIKYDYAGNAVCSFPVKRPENSMTFGYCFEVFDDGVLIYLDPELREGFVMVYSLDGELLASGYSTIHPRRTKEEHQRAVAPNGIVYEIRRRFLRREEVVKILPNGKETVLTRLSVACVLEKVLLWPTAILIVATVLTFSDFTPKKEADPNEFSRFG